MYSNELPVSESVLATWRAIYREGFTLLAAVAIPAACISIIEIIGQAYPDQFPYPLLFWILMAPFFVLFAVVCHRSVILGGDSLPNRFGLFWSRRETRFLGWTIVIILVTALAGVGVELLAMLSPFGPLLTSIGVALLIGYVYVRVAMVLPATAVDDSTSFDQAWFLTSGNGLRVVFVIVFATAPVVIVLTLLAYLLDFEGFFIIFLAVLGRHAIALFAICALSVSYRELIDYENSALS